MKQFEEADKQVGPDEIQAARDPWGILLAEVRANPNLAPAGPKAQALGRRWEELTERTTHGYQAVPGLKEAIWDNYE